MENIKNSMLNLLHAGHEQQAEVIGHAHEHSGLIGIVDYFIYDVFKSEPSSKFAQLFSIIISDFLQILILLTVIVLLISIVQTYIPYKKLKSLTKNLNPVVSILGLTLLGVLSPTCICTTIPLFIGLLTLGIPIYSAFGFLMAGALLNISSILVMINLLDIQFMITYIITCFAIIILTCLIIYVSKIKNKKLDITNAVAEQDFKNLKSRLVFSLSNLWHIFKSIYLYIILGLVLSGLFSIFLPTNFIDSINNNSIAFLFLGAIIGIVVHMDIISIAPLISSMIDSNINIFILIPFLISVSFFSIPTLFMLKKYIKIKHQLFIWANVFIIVCISGLIIRII